MKLMIKGKKDNDYVQILQKNQISFKRVDTVQQAVEQTPKEGVLFILADDYPCKGFQIHSDLIKQIKDQNIKVFIEFGFVTEKSFQRAIWERGVVERSTFNCLKQNDLIDFHGCVYVPEKKQNALISIGRIAGFESACFGIPDDAHSLLYALDENLLVSTTKFSDFVKQRVSPEQRGYDLLEDLLNHLGIQAKIKEKIQPTVYLNEKTDKKGCFDQSIDWMIKNMVCINGNNTASLEGYGSHIEYDGLQRKNQWIRADCTSEVALALAVDWKLNNNIRSYELSKQMFDYLWKGDAFRTQEQVPVKDMIQWSNDSKVYYGDDNARAIISAWKGMDLLDCYEWEEAVRKCLYANFRLTGKEGFRKSRIDYPGTEEPFDGKVLSPHYQCYLWAAYLKGSLRYQDESLAQKAQMGIDHMMKGFDQEWTWTNGITQEYARMLLPLSWASHMDDKNTVYLEKIIEAIKENMHPSGAIMEKLGNFEKGKYPQLKSNEEYGVTESPVIQQNGDPVTDLLYTLGFGFLGLHEAKQEKLFSDMSDFLCKIQIKSEIHPYLNGAWLRSFHLERWEYFGSSADAGWGAWCAEAGWNNGWTATVLGLSLLDEFLF